MLTVETSHGDAKESSYAQEGLVCGAETSGQFQHDEENIVDDERPLASITISRKTESDGADRSQHEYESNAPSNVCFADIKRLGDIQCSERYCEEVEGIPGPRNERTEEEQPLLRVQKCQYLERILDLVHWRFESREPRCQVSSDAHLFDGLIVG